jgi:3-methylfumaryl-CoA hydratase
MTSGAVIERSELLIPGPAEALGGLLGVAVPDLANGQSLPLLWHWIYLLDHCAQSDLGPDGHPVRSSLPAPPGQGRRRMWAGGRVRASGPLRCGSPATKRTSVVSVTEKHGRSGHLTFVTVGNQILQNGRLVVDEQQDLVYREAASLAPQAIVEDVSAHEVPVGEDEWEIEVSPSLLFRFSALTYNAHRIHYDRDYARDVEGYPALLTHGPLQALAMAEAARALTYGSNPPEVSFEYRLLSPLFDHQGMIVKAVHTRDGTATSVRDSYGRKTAMGTLRSTYRLPPDIAAAGGSSRPLPGHVVAERSVRPPSTTRVVPVM